MMDSTDLVYDVQSFDDAKKLAGFLVQKYGRGVQLAGICDSREAAETIFKREVESRAQRGMGLLSHTSDTASPAPQENEQTDVERKVQQHLESILNSGKALQREVADALTPQEKDALVAWESRASMNSTATSMPSLRQHPFKPELRLEPSDPEGAAAAQHAHPSGIAGRTRESKLEEENRLLRQQLEALASTYKMGEPAASRTGKAIATDHAADQNTIGLFEKSHNEMKTAVQQHLQNLKAGPPTHPQQQQQQQQQQPLGTQNNPDDAESTVPDPFVGGRDSPTAISSPTGGDIPRPQRVVPVEAAPVQDNHQAVQQAVQDAMAQSALQQGGGDKEAKREELRKVIDDLLRPNAAAAAATAAVTSVAPPSEPAVPAAGDAPAAAAAPQAPAGGVIPGPPYTLPVQSNTNVNSYFWESYDRELQRAMQEMGSNPSATAAAAHVVPPPLPAAVPAPLPAPLPAAAAAAAAAVPMAVPPTATATATATAAAAHVVPSVPLTVTSPHYGTLSPSASQFAPLSSTAVADSPLAFSSAALRSYSRKSQGAMLSPPVKITPSLQ